VLQPIDDVSQTYNIMRQLLTCSNAIRTIDQHKRHDGHIPLRLDGIVVVLQVVQERIIRRVEDSASHSGNVGEDVTSRCGVFPSLKRIH
jgi:hypothetical protein